MPNPRLLLCDTDSLIQLFLTRHSNRKLLPLRTLLQDYGIQPAVVEEVEAELMWTRKYKDQFAPVLKKAMTSGIIQRLDATALSQYVPAHLATGVFATCQALGQQYEKHIDPGEAYTFATAVALCAPAMSNDRTAIDALGPVTLAVPVPVLRAFDIFAFSYQTGVLLEGDCDQARKELLRLGEHIPAAFQNASFANGIRNFVPRLLDSEVQPIGRSPSPGPGYASQLKIARKA